MDELMSSVFLTFAGLDVNKCIPLPRPYSNLEIKLRDQDKIIPVPDLLSECAQIVNIDQLSTRHIAEHLAAKGFPQYSHLFFEVVIAYAKFMYQGQAIGYGINTTYYNGYPTVLKPEDFENLDLLRSVDTFDPIAITNKMSPQDFMVPPVRGIIPAYHLSREFVKANPIYITKKKWGFNARERLRV